MTAIMEVRNMTKRFSEDVLAVDGITSMFKKRKSSASSTRVAVNLICIQNRKGGKT